MMRASQKYCVSKRECESIYDSIPYSGHCYRTKKIKFATHLNDTTDSDSIYRRRIVFVLTGIENEYNLLDFEYLFYVDVKDSYYS